MSTDTESELKRIEVFEGNPAQRCACVLLLDTSSSMDGDRIANLNAGLLTLKRELQHDDTAKKRVELAIITFDSEVKLVRDFGPVDEMEVPTLTAQGLTFMGQAIQMALDKIDERKAEYKQFGIPYYRPWLFLLTDGRPEGESAETVDQAKQRLHEKIAAKGVQVFPVAVGEGVELSKLSDLAGNDALRLDAAMWSDLFVWLSASLKSVSASKDVRAQIDLPPPGWRTAN